MVRGKKVLLCGFLSFLATISSLQAAQEQQINSTTTIYGQLYKIFAGQLSQNSPTNNTIAGLAVIGSTPPKPTNPLIKPDTKPAVPVVLSGEDKTNKITQLLCIYCDICAQREAISQTPIKQDIPISALEKLGIVPTGKTSMNCTVLKKLSIPENTVFGEVERAALFMRLPGFTELQDNREVTNYFAEHDDMRRRALRAIEKIRSAQNDFLWLFLAEEQKKDPFEACYWKAPWTTLNKSVPGLLIGDIITWFLVLKGLTPPCAYQGMIMKGRNSISTIFAALTAGDLSGAISNIAHAPLAIATGFGQGIAGEFVSLWPGTFAYDVTKTDKTIKIHNNTDFPFTSLGDRQAYIEANICPQSEETDWASALLIRSISPFALKFNDYDLTTGKIKTEKEQSFLRVEKRGKAVSGAFALGGLAIYEYINYLNIRNTRKELQIDLEAFRLAQSRLISIARLLDGLTELRKIAEESKIKPLEALAKELTAFENLRTTNRDFSQLCELLRTNTFKGEPSAFSNRARILLAHSLLRRCKRLFLPALQSGAKIEVFVSAAEFYAKHRDAEKPVCLVDFVDEAQPRLELENSWNILVNEKNAVCLSIKFGKNGSQHAIFSGPNGTGKSTDENAIAHAVFLSRLGIACASRATMTPFDIFAIHRNEQENVELGDSSFMAQKAHFDAICAEIAALTDKRMLIIMDEPLNGTVEEEAGRIIFERCRDLLANQKQVICILATHAKQPTELEAATNGAFANYYVKVLELSDTEFKRTFELERGIPNWWFDDSDRRHRFVEWLSQERKIDTTSKK